MMRSSLSPHPVIIHAGIVIRSAQLAQHGKALCRERLVQFDHIEVGNLEAKATHQFLGHGRGADAGGRHGDAYLPGVWAAP